MALTIEHPVSCPHCWETTSVVVDLSAGDQTLIEDCQVCCNPMQLTLTIADGELIAVDAEPAQ
jgi:Cysteine-rich CPXCG